MLTADVANPPGREAVRSGGGRVRRFLLGAPEEPRWARPALWAVLGLATLLYVWNLGAVGDANSYYAAAVLSGTKSWKAFFFGSLDAGSFITVDKPPVALWVMGLSARIFGYSTWSMLLPQAAAGVAAIVLVFAMVRRAFTAVVGVSGAIVAGLVAALVMALTPITVAINRDNNPDTVLVLLLVLAAWALQRAVERDRLGWLVASAVFVGFAFNTKMLQAFLVLPAFTLVYLLCARAGLWRRVAQLAVAGAALVVSAGWWMVLVDLIPASDRPFIGSSTKNSVWDLVIGYNGLGRVFGGDGNGGGGPKPSGAGSAAAREVGRQFGAGGSFGGGGGFGGASGAGRLFNETIGGQISWLIPFAALAFVAGLVLLLRSFGLRGMRTQLATAALLLWGGWLVVHYVVFSFSQGTFHPYYTTTMAPAIGALVGAGGVMLVRASGRPWAWVLPVGLVGSGVWAFVLLRRTPSWHPWLAWSVLIATCFGGVTLLAVRLKARQPSRPLRQVATAATVVGLVGVLAGPAAYAFSPLTANASGGMGGSNPLAGPSTGDAGGPGGPMTARRFRNGFPAGLPNGPLPGGQAPIGQGLGGQELGGQGLGGQGLGGQGATGQGAGGQGLGGQGVAGQGAGGQMPGGPGAGGQLGTSGQAPGVAGMPSGGGPGGEVSASLINYLVRNQGSATWLVAVSSARSADTIILRTGKPVIAMGGFTGRDPAMTVDKLKAYIASGKLRYVMTGGDGPGGGAFGGGDSSVTQWVTKDCTAVAASDYGATTSSSALYRCS